MKRTTGTQVITDFYLYYQGGVTESRWRDSVHNLYLNRGNLRQTLQLHARIHKRENVVPADLLFLQMRGWRETKFYKGEIVEEATMERAGSMAAEQKLKERTRQSTVSARNQDVPTRIQSTNSETVYTPRLNVCI